MLGSGEIVKKARENNLVILAFNVPYLPIVEPTVRAIADLDSFAFLEVARPEWTKFEAYGPAEVMEEYKKWQKPEHTRLHLDHIPVIDEDWEQVDHIPIIKEAIRLGYNSVMVDGSRLSLDENIAATREVADMAHAAGIPCEAELGAVMGHEEGPSLPYEELFASGKGFTDPDEAKRFVQESGCDWLSVAVGSIHGAISKAARHEKKIAARLDLEHIDKLYAATGVPLVLHGGSGVKQEYVIEGIKRGITKVNIGTETRQAYENALKDSGDIGTAQEATYERTCWLIRDYYGTDGIRSQITG